MWYCNPIGASDERQRRISPGIAVITPRCRMWLIAQMSNRWCECLRFFIILSLICLSRVCSDVNDQAAPTQGAGGDMPKLIFDKGVLVGVDKDRIDYTKPGGDSVFSTLFLSASSVLMFPIPLTCSTYRWYSGSRWRRKMRP